MSEHAELVQTIKAWRTQRAREGRTNGLMDYFALHDICATCKGSRIWHREGHVEPCEPCGGSGKAGTFIVQQAKIRELEHEVKRLEEALRHYTEATVVSSWGMQELADDGETARDALRLPHPSEHKLAARLNLFCRCEACESDRADDPNDGYEEE